jgi:hypothetical protein
VFPVKDDIPTAYAAALAALLATAAVGLGLAGLGPASPLALALLAIGAALFGPALVGNLPALAAVLILVPGAFGALSGDPRTALGAACGALVAGHLVLFPRARILSLALVPFYFTLVAVPAAVWAAIWFAATALAWPAGLTALAGGALAAVVVCCATRSLRRGRAVGYR